MIRMFFAGTGVRPREWDFLKDAKPIYEDHKNMLVTKYKDSVSYYFAGPLSKIKLDQGTYSINNNFERGVKILSSDINKALKENPSKEIVVEIGGHSRGGVAAVKVAEKIRKDFKDHKNVKVNLISLDPVPGPDSYRSGGKIDLTESETNKSLVIYSMDSRKMLYTPSQLHKADVVIISNKDHNGVFGGRDLVQKGDLSDVYHYYYKRKPFTLSEMLNFKKGVYFSDKYTITKLTTSNLEKCISEIYQKCKDSKRQRILIDSIIEKSNFRLDNILEANPEYKKSFESKLNNINKKLMLKRMFKYTLSMFGSGSKFSVLLNREGLYEPILEAKKAIVDDKKTNPSKAYNILKEAKKNKNLGIYSNTLLDLIMKKINNRYKLEKA